MNQDFNQLMQRYNFAEGGEVSYPLTRSPMAYQGGDLSGMAGMYGLGDQDGRDEQAIAQLMTPQPAQMPAQMAQEVPPQAPQQMQQMGGRAMPPGLADMLSRYQGEGTYGPELKMARESASRENEAFNALLQDAISKKTDNAPSKSEMYFRLAAAFGAPTKTGQFSESMGAASGVLGDYAKETRMGQREGSAGRRDLAIQAQQSKMTGAKEDLSTLRGLASEEMKDKRAIASKMMEEYIRSGQPQSAAGKQARDEGLVSGSPEFQARVSKISELAADKQMAGINATLAGMSAAQANMALAAERLAYQKEKDAKLTIPEMKLKTDTEDLISDTGQSLDNLKRAYALNPNTFDSSLVDKLQRVTLEASGSKSPKVENTRLMENLLEKSALSSLKATFPGAISNDERVALMQTQGMGAKSVEERGGIMRGAFEALRKIEERAKKRLGQINKGEYRNTESSYGSID